MAEATSKEALLNELKQARAEWDELVGSLDATTLSSPELDGGWSVKDVIAHIAAWEARTVKWLEAVARGTTPEPAPWGAGLSEDEENAFIYNANRNRSLQDVLDESRRIHDSAVNSVRAMSEEELTASRPWLGDRSLADALPGNSYEHYRDHAKTVRAWLETRGA